MAKPFFLGNRSESLLHKIDQHITTEGESRISLSQNLCKTYGYKSAMNVAFLTIWSIYKSNQENNSTLEFKLICLMY